MLPGLLAVAARHVGGRVLLSTGSSEAPLSSGMKILYVGMSIFLCAVSGLMAGLTLGLLSLDKVELEVLRRSGTHKQRWLVKRIEPVVRHPHFLLVTLLLVNAFAYETLPIFLDRLLNPVVAIAISTTAVLFFGEIVPQAVCKRYGLEVGAYLAWLVRGLMIVTSPISWPIAKVLDWLLGEEMTYFRRAELKALLDMHAEPPDEGGGPTLTQDEVKVIQGALDMANKTAEAAMTPLEKVFMVSSDAVINDDLLKQVIDKGHSRVPVYEGSRQNIIGLILVKELVLVDEDEGVQVKELSLREVPFVRSSIPLYDVLKIFRTGRSHMAVLTRDAELPASQDEEQGGGVGVGAGAADGRATPLPVPGEPPIEPQEAIGIITIEDVLEELLQQEIVDETDRFVDNLQTVQTTTLLSLQHLPPNLRKFLTRTFRAGSPANRAAFKAALQATPVPPLDGPPDGVAAAAGSLFSPPASLNTSPNKPVAIASALVAAASAASLVEEVTAAGIPRPKSAQAVVELQPQGRGRTDTGPPLQRRRASPAKNHRRSRSEGRLEDVPLLGHGSPGGSVSSAELSHGEEVMAGWAGGGGGGGTNGASGGWAIPRQAAGRDDLHLRHTGRASPTGQHPLHSPPRMLVNPPKPPLPRVRVRPGEPGNGVGAVGGGSGEKGQ